jgi:hypothetical protein
MIHLSLFPSHRREPFGFPRMNQLPIRRLTDQPSFSALVFADDARYALHCIALRAKKPSYFSSRKISILDASRIVELFCYSYPNSCLESSLAMFPGMDWDWVVCRKVVGMGEWFLRGVVRDWDCGLPLELFWDLAEVLMGETAPPLFRFCLAPSMERGALVVAVAWEGCRAMYIWEAVLVMAPFPDLVLGCIFRATFSEESLEFPCVPVVLVRLRPVLVVVGLAWCSGGTAPVLILLRASERGPAAEEVMLFFFRTLLEAFKELEGEVAAVVVWFRLKGGADSGGG